MKQPKTFSELLQKQLDKQKRRQEESRKAIEEARQRVQAQRTHQQEEREFQAHIHTETHGDGSEPLDKVLTDYERNREEEGNRIADEHEAQD